MTRATVWWTVRLLPPSQASSTMDQSMHSRSGASANEMHVGPYTIGFVQP